MPEPWIKYASQLNAIDEILGISKNKILVKKNIRNDEPYLRGHFPEFPIFPGVFLVESAEQAVKYLLRCYYCDAVLDEVVSTRFLNPVFPGDILECECECDIDHHNNSIIAKCILQVSGNKVAKAKLKFSFENHNDCTI